MQQLLASGVRGAVVTGGAGGLGRALGDALTRAGFAVRLADLDEDRARAAAADVGGTGVRLDVTDRDAVRALAEQVDREDGLAVWVNNAGVLFTRPSWAHPDHEVRTMFDVNVHGTMHGTWAALDVMRRQGRGHVVNVVSLAGLAAPPGETVYAATKHAALGFTTGTLLDLRGDGVRDVHVTAVCPDGIWTPMLHDKVDDPQAAFSWQGVLLRPEAVAAQVVDVLRRPRPVVSVPRRRGGVVRAYAAFPTVAVALRPLVVRAARAKQKRFARSLRR